jgi:hypothetical protein
VRLSMSIIASPEPCERAASIFSPLLLLFEDVIVMVSLHEMRRENQRARRKMKPSNERLIDVHM